MFRIGINLSHSPSLSKKYIHLNQGGQFAWLRVDYSNCQRMGGLNIPTMYHTIFVWYIEHWGF